MSARYQCTRRKTGQEAPRDCHCSIHDITCLAQFLLIFLSLHLSHCYLQLLIRHILISSDYISESVRKCYFYYNNALCIHCSETYSFLFWMTNTDYHLPGGLESYCISSHIGAELTWQKSTTLTNRKDHSRGTANMRRCRSQLSSPLVLWCWRMANNKSRHLVMNRSWCVKDTIINHRRLSWS